MLKPTAHPAPPELLARWSAAGLRREQHVGWALDQAAEARPDGEAVVLASERVTFGELRARADAIAEQLVGAGVGAGDVVTWTLPNGIDAVATAAAIWRIGAVSAPVVTIYRHHELEFIVGELRPAALIASGDVRGRDLCAELDEACAAAGVLPRARVCTHGEVDGWAPRALAPRAPLPGDVRPGGPEDVCLVLYTSGTTAKPKGVMHCSRALVQEVASMQHAWGLTFRDTMLMASPLTHITGMLQGLLVPCMVGARSVLMDRWDPDSCVELIERERATYMAGATPFLSGILQAFRARGVTRPALRQYCCGGAAVPPALVEEADALGIAAYRCWGMTELPTTTLASERDPLARRARYDGRAAAGVQIEAVDADRRPLPAGEEGELRVRGPEQMLGYVDAERTAEAVDEAGWFYTGDLGIIDDERWVRITGRLKDIINRGGEKFSAREVEDLLIAHPSVGEVAVVALPDERLGELACAVIVAEADLRVDTEALTAFLRAQRIATQKLPERYEIVAALPRTASGKVQKHLIVAALSGG
ncbi:MAG TPA: AMP-binding protein [Baekduia sp.]|uniref:AMP-binding protein n=1 Tax=Baekduia sp. TaxID=2600305 RepID=UPI002B990D5F|nr:AMP-binding protein [Baekduia sp.]HMJ37841.1 AMP-binding protein [Baekduia sp.]